MSQTASRVRPRFSGVLSTAALGLTLLGQACHSAAGSDGAPPLASTSSALDGELRSFVVEHEDGTHRVGYALETSQGEHVELRLDTPLALSVGDIVRVTGHDVARSRAEKPAAARRLVAVERMERLESALGRAEQAVVDGAPKTVRVAIVLLNFQGVAAQGFTPDDARNRLATVRSYYQEISYGIWNVEGDVFGPVEVPRPGNCDLDTITNLARGAVQVDGYDHVAVALPRNEDSGLDCACGLAWVGRAPAQGNGEVQHGSLYTCTDPNAFAHELGHGFGLSHASTADCDGVAMKRNVHDACPIAEYGNMFNTMGNGLGHMNAFQKSQMKWLDRCNIVRVASDGEFELSPMQIETEGLQALQIANGDTRDGNPLFYYVEFRNPALATFNAGDGTPREKGIGVHIDVAPDFRVGGGDQRPILLDVTEGSSGDFNDPRLTAGRSFADPDGRVTVEVLETSSDRARVRVTFPGGGAGANLCADGSTPGEGGEPRPTAATLFQDCDYGGWAISLPEGDYDASTLALLGVRDNDASSLQLSDGYEAVMFDNGDFTGTSVTASTTNACFVADGFNDVLSSLRIRRIGGGSGADAGVPGTGDGDDGMNPGGDGTSAGDGEGDGDGASGSGDGSSDDPGDQAPGSGGQANSGCNAVPGSAPRGVALMMLALGALLRRRRRN